MPEVNELIASELSAIRQAVEARGPVDIDVLARRVVELSNASRPLNARLEEEAAAAAASDPEILLRRGELRLAPGQDTERGGRVIESGRFKGRTTDELLFVARFLRRAEALNPSTVRPVSPELAEIVTRAESATATGAGAEYVPTFMAAQLWIDMFLQSKITQALQRIQMPTNPFDLPQGWGILTWRKGTRNVQSTPFDPVTSKGTLTATEQVVEIDWDYTLDEDSIIAILPTLRTELAREGAEQMDAFVLNADAQAGANLNVNLGDGTPAADAYYLSDG